MKRFKSTAARAKLERFQLETIESFDDFSSRQLNDTRYASKLAADFLGLLYGGQVDAEGHRRIQAGRGQVTAYLRDVWSLNKILGDGGEKSRDDHRHHAVDAIAIALTDAGIVKRLSDAAKRAPQEHRRRFATVPVPWDGFQESVQAAIEAIIVSHRVDRKVNSALHEETNYGPGADGYCHVRKPLANLSKGEIEGIVDDRVREIVKAALNGGDPKKVFADAKNHPYLTTSDGRRIPIHKARTQKKITPFTIGQGHRERRVVTDSNHHIEIFETTAKHGEKLWGGRVVSRYEALRRANPRKGQRPEPIVKHDHGPGKQFLFSLSQNEVVKMKNDDGQEGMYRVIGISQFTAGAIVLDFQQVSDARQVSKIPRQGRTRTPNTMCKSGCEKLVISPDGIVHRSRT